MNKSESIKAGLRKRFQSGESKQAKRKCYGHKSGANGKPFINQEEAKIVNYRFLEMCGFCGFFMLERLLTWQIGNRTIQ